MDKSKIKRLRAQGWQFGDASEFLGLSQQESAYVELKLALSQNLKQQRQQLQLTQDDLARMIRSSQSRVAKMEAGDPSVSVDLLIKSLLAMGVSRKDLGRAIS